MADSDMSWSTLRRLALNRDDYTCRNCGVERRQEGSVNLEVHHIVPRHSGGEDELTNLATLCRQCHKAIHSSVDAPTADKSKLTIDYDEFFQRMQDVNENIDLLNELVQKIDGIMDQPDRYIPNPNEFPNSSHSETPRLGHQSTRQERKRASYYRAKWKEKTK